MQSKDHNNMVELHYSPDLGMYLGKTCTVHRRIHLQYLPSLSQSNPGPEWGKISPQREEVYVILVHCPFEYTMFQYHLEPTSVKQLKVVT